MCLKFVVIKISAQIDKIETLLMQELEATLLYLF